MRWPNISVRSSLFTVVGLLGALLVADAAYRFVSAWGRSQDALLAQRDARADRFMLTALQSLRFERSNSLSYLSLSSEDAAKVREKLAIVRKELDSAMQAVIGQSSDFVHPELRSALATARADYEKFVPLRATLDEALLKQPSARDQAFSGLWIKGADQAIAALEAVSTLLGERMKQLAPESRVFVDIKQYGWRTRATIGQGYSIFSQAVAKQAPFSQSQAESMAATFAKAEVYWTQVRGELQKAAMPDTITRAAAAAQEAAFSPGAIAARQAVRDNLAAGRNIGMSLLEFQKDNADRQRTVLEVAAAAMDYIVDVADQAAERARHEMLLMCLVIGVALFLSIGGLIVVQYRVSKPLLATAVAMRRLSEGDLQIDVPGVGRRDEFGAMAAAVQVFKDSLIRARQLETETAEARLAAEDQRKTGMRQMADSFERAVGGIIGMVSSSATELQVTAQTMTATATETASQSTTVAAAAEEAASNVNTVAAAAEELGSSVQEIGRQVAGSAELAQRAVHEADQTGTLVQELSAAVSRIGDVVGLISNIAGQTNLLALNATIEAARAGAAGKGFAVVASEVKALAEQTAKATSEISGQITQIQASTGQAVTSIGGITGRIREISGVATSIAAAVEQQGAATQEIVRNVAQAAMGTGEVTSNISGVAGAAEETGAAASQVLGAASELSRQSEHLAAEVGRFLDTVRAA
ncbi:chemotaxis protein [Methylobacterium radiotolerans]